MTARRDAARRMAQVCVALGISPTEYRALTLTETTELLEEVTRKRG